MKIKKLLLATLNSDKVIEIKNLLKDLNIEIVPASKVVDVPHVDEDQPTLEGNARKKALVLSKFTGLPALADDTGLEVDALDGAPGVFSSRYAGENASYQDNVKKLLADLHGVPVNNRSAQFRCVMALATGDHVETVAGICKGSILDHQRGDKGFGYDPVFYIPGLEKTFAELSTMQKNKISHRGIALVKIRELLKSKYL
ncbi:RdgB/HAM1 family non-canonical purine NTP pyrophosphatase [candidate division KSB1 bacterium]|nr:RdgB/HAM1 family non-canonical purine NTP pyrophosphatase [candidate division KSB1 bacterium]